MALDTSSSSRNALAQSVVDICLDDDATLSEREIQLTFDILHKLLQSVELGGGATSRSALRIAAMCLAIWLSVWPMTRSISPIRFLWKVWCWRTLT